MYQDEDIKIVGNKPSIDVKRNKALEGMGENIDAKIISSAKEWGKAVALKFIADAKEGTSIGNNANTEMVVQRRLLLSFAATVGFEKFTDNDTITGIAQKTFLDTIKKGLGVAYIELENAPNREEYRETLLYACFIDCSNDFTSEGSKGFYIYNLISLLDDKEYFKMKYEHEYNYTNYEELVECEAFDDYEHMTFLNDFCEGQSDCIVEKVISLYELAKYYREKELN